MHGVDVILRTSVDHSANDALSVRLNQEESFGLGMTLK